MRKTKKRRLFLRLILKKERLYGLQRTEIRISVYYGVLFFVMTTKIVAKVL